MSTVSSEVLELSSELLGAPVYDGPFEDALVELDSSARELAVLAITRALDPGEDVELTDEDLARTRTHLQILNSLERYITDEMEAGHLRPHQHSVFSSLDDFLSNPPVTEAGELDRRGYLDMAPGTGKTVVYAILLRALAGHRREGEQPIRSLILLPRLALSDQAIGDAEEEVGLAHFAPDVRATEYNGNVKDLSGDAVVMTYQSFRNVKDTDEFKAQQFGLVICDELQRGLGPKTLPMIEEYTRDKVAIGLSGSVEYALDRKVEHLFNRLIHRLRQRESIEQGLLSPVRCIIHATDTVIPKLQPTSEFSPSELEKLAKLKSRNDVAIDYAKSFIAAGRKGVIGCVPGGNMFHSRQLAQELNGQTVTREDGTEHVIVAESVGSHRTHEENMAVLKAYARGEIDVLTTYRMIAEGWDSKVASFFINACPTVSPDVIIQALGRITRLKADGMSAIFVDIVDRAVGRRQCTALHILGEEAFVLERVIGELNASETEGENAEGYLAGLLNPDLLAALLANEGRLLRDITIPHNERRQLTPAERLLERRRAKQQRDDERELQRWERRLEKELMPAELERDEFGFTRKFVLEALRATRRAQAASGNDYTGLDEVLENLPTQSAAQYGLPDHKLKSRLAAMREWPLMFDGVWDALPEGYDEAEEFDLEEEFMKRLEEGFRIGLVEQAFEKLNSRERLIIEMWFGMGRHNQPLTLDEIGDEFGVTRERVRQIAKKAMGRMESMLNIHSLSLPMEEERRINMSAEDYLARQQAIREAVYKALPSDIQRALAPNCRRGSEDAVLEVDKKLAKVISFANLPRAKELLGIPMRFNPQLALLGALRLGLVDIGVVGTPSANYVDTRAYADQSFTNPHNGAAVLHLRESPECFFIGEQRDMGYGDFVNRTKPLSSALMRGHSAALSYPEAQLKAGTLVVDESKDLTEESEDLETKKQELLEQILTDVGHAISAYYRDGSFKIRSTWESVMPIAQARPPYRYPNRRPYNQLTTAPEELSAATIVMLEEIDERLQAQFELVKGGAISGVRADGSRRTIDNYLHYLIYARYGLKNALNNTHKQFLARIAESEEQAEKAGVPYGKELMLEAVIQAIAKQAKGFMGY